MTNNKTKQIAAVAEKAPSQQTTNKNNRLLQPKKGFAMTNNKQQTTNNRHTKQIAAVAEKASSQ